MPQHRDHFPPVDRAAAELTPRYPFGQAALSDKHIRIIKKIFEAKPAYKGGGWNLDDPIHQRIVVWTLSGAMQSDERGLGSSFLTRVNSFDFLLKNGYTKGANLYYSLLEHIGFSQSFIKSKVESEDSSGRQKISGKGEMLKLFKNAMSSQGELKEALVVYRSMLIFTNKANDDARKPAAEKTRKRSAKNDADHTPTTPKARRTDTESISAQQLHEQSWRDFTERRNQATLSSREDDAARIIASMKRSPSIPSMIPSPGVDKDTATDTDTDPETALDAINSIPAVLSKLCQTPF